MNRPTNTAVAQQNVMLAQILANTGGIDTWPLSVETRIANIESRDTLLIMGIAGVFLILASAFSYGYVSLRDKLDTRIEKVDDRINAMSEVLAVLKSEQKH